MTAPPRVHAEELLDAPQLDATELKGALAQVAAVDRWLGGARAVRRHLEPVVAGREGGLVLDVGTGNGAVLARLVAWARQVGGGGWRGVGVDLHPDVVAVAGGHAAPAGPGHRPPTTVPPTVLLRADGLRLPFADRTFDAVVCTLTLHHFAEPEAVRLVAEMSRVSRGVVVVSDLERSRLNHLGARLLAATWWRANRLTRHDGPLSVLRSFTRAELARVGRSAGLVAPEVRRHFPFRLVLEGRVPTVEGDA